MSRGARTRPSTLVGAWVGNGLVTNLGDFESIATTTVGAGGASSVSFNLTGISSYKHLQIRFFGKSSSSGDVNLTYNSDTGSNYRIHTVRGYGSSVASDSYAVTAIGAFVTGDFAAGVTDILDYSNTNKYKTVRSLLGGDANGEGEVGLASGLYLSTSAVSQIDFILPGGSNWKQYSSFALYGIKG